MLFLNHVCSFCLIEESVEAVWGIMTSSGHSSTSLLLPEIPLPKLGPQKGAGVNISSFVLEQGECTVSFQQ